MRLASCVDLLLRAFAVNLLPNTPREVTDRCRRDRRPRPTGRLTSAFARPPGMTPNRPLDRRDVAGQRPLPHCPQAAGKDQPPRIDRMLDNPPLLTIHRDFRRPDPALVARFRGAQTSHLVDAMDGRGA